MAQSDVNQWYKDVVDAVEHHDAGPAFRLLKQWDAMVALFPMEWTSNAQFQRTLPVLKKDLWYTAFPELPLVDAQKILSSEVLGCAKREIDLGELLSARFTFTAYGAQEKERLALKEAILKNTELIGGVSIGEWLSTFDKLFDPDTREEDGVNNFMTRESRVANLGKDEQGILRTVLDMYDRYLATELLSIFDLAAMVQGAAAPSSARQASGTSRLGGQPSVVRLSLLQALSKYEQLGNQLITEERLKLKSQVETVRPSLLYWIKYYRDELGVGHHDSVQRGNFLFRSENGKKLTPEERERVNLVLKSVEENYPVEIDTEQNVIIFPPFVPQAAPARPPQAAALFQPPLAPQRLQQPSFQSNAAFQFGDGNMRSASHAAPLPSSSQPGTLSFSSKHVLPAEKDQRAAQTQPAQPVQGAVTPRASSSLPPRPMTPVTAGQKSNPFHIRPVSLGESDES